MTAPTKKPRLTAAQAAQDRTKVLAKLRRLKCKELEHRREYGKLMLRWGRENSGLLAFFVLGGALCSSTAEQLDGLVGVGRWAIDNKRWTNGIDIVVESSNPNVHLIRFLGKSRKLSNEQAHLSRARQRQRPTQTPAFPWESSDDAVALATMFRHFKATRPSTGICDLSELV
jgi:hypothetical protein